MGTAMTSMGRALAKVALGSSAVAFVSGAAIYAAAPHPPRTPHRVSDRGELEALAGGPCRGRVAPPGLPAAVVKDRSIDYDLGFGMADAPRGVHYDGRGANRASNRACPTPTPGYRQLRFEPSRQTDHAEHDGHAQHRAKPRISHLRNRGWAAAIRAAARNLASSWGSWKRWGCEGHATSSAMTRMGTTHA